MAILLAGAAALAVIGRSVPAAPKSEHSSPQADAVVLDFPFRGTWRVENSPARRVPSHGTYTFGTSHAIDFVAVTDRGRSAPRTWRSLVAAEPPEIFRGFGQPILAPLSGTVVLTHAGEPDHEARRSQLTLVPYMLGQAERVRAGIPLAFRRPGASAWVPAESEIVNALAMSSRVGPTVTVRSGPGLAGGHLGLCGLPGPDRGACGSPRSRWSGRRG